MSNCCWWWVYSGSDLAERTTSSSLLCTSTPGEKFSFFSRCFCCDGNLKWTRPFIFPLGFEEAQLSFIACEFQRPLFLSLCCFSFPFLYPGSPLMGITSEHVLLIKVSIIYQICPCVQCSAQFNQSVALRQLGWSDLTAPAAVSVRVQPTHLSKSQDVLTKTRRPVGFAKSERFLAEDCAGIFLTKIKIKKKEAWVSLTSMLCHSFGLPSRFSNCCWGWWKLGEGAERRRRVPENMLIFFFFF